MKSATLLLLALFMGTLLSGCNTFRGFGEDVSHVGGVISRAAK
ncbi:EncA/B family entericidin [Enterobacterales bacterium CwR94]|nr:EncA/B family entericidin [Enterobacterales bacterium CwR94]